MFFFFSFEELPEKISQLRNLNKNQSRTKSNAKRERDGEREREGEKRLSHCAISNEYSQF